MLQDQYAHASFDKIMLLSLLVAKSRPGHFLYVLLDFDSTAKSILSGEIYSRETIYTCFRISLDIRLLSQ